MTTTPAEPSTSAPGGVAPVPPTVGPRVDPRPRQVRLVAPVATLVGVLAAVSYVGVVDPNEPGHYPLCPTKAALGVDCPGCGSMRAIHALANGDVGRALDHNVLVVAVLPFLAWWWVAWVRRAWTGVTAPVSARTARWRAVGTWVLLVGVTVFGIVRNVVPYLGSGVG